MSVLKVLRKGIQIANKVTKSVQTVITHTARTGDGGVGSPAYAAPVKRPAIAEKKLRQVKTTEGVEVMSNLTITILDPTVIIKPMDVITLPDGTTGEVINVGGFVDPETKKTMYTEAYL